MKTSTLLLLCTFTLAITLTSAQETNIYDAINQSRLMVDSLIKDGRVPGIDVAVYKNGEIVWSEGFGFADLEHRVPVIAGNTLFRIGSVSKPLSTAALGRLMDDGKIDLSKAVQTYVPSFPVKKYELTLKQIGGHIGGIRHYKGKEMLSGKYYPDVNSGLEIFMNDPLLFEPGTKYSYSSYGFNLLSACIEGASREDFLPFVQREVFDALNMSNTYADINSEIILNRTSFYALGEDGKYINAPYVDNSYKWAGGGFISTTTDLIKFGIAHIKPGYLTKETLNELISSQTLSSGKETGYGVGWSTINQGELIGYGHSGGSIGGITQFRIFPSEDMIVVFLSNSSDTRYGNIVERIINLFANID